MLMVKIVNFVPSCGQLTRLDADIGGTLQERATGLIDQILRLRSLEVWPGPAAAAASVARSPSPSVPLPVSVLYTTLQGEPIFLTRIYTPLTAYEAARAGYTL
jgi:hypothetical protein